jgi:SnoaL-like domain
MSSERVELFRHACELFNRRDWEAFSALMGNRIELQTRLAAIEGGYHGQAGLRRWWDDVTETMPDYRVDVLEVRDYGDSVVARVQGSGSGGSSATPVVDPFWQVVRWEDDRVVWWRNCSTEAEALEAVQLRDGE